MSDAQDIERLIDAKLAPIQARLDELSLGVGELVAASGLLNRVMPGSSLARLHAAWRTVADERAHRREVARARKVLERLEVDR